MKNWKSTVQGFLSLALAVGMALLAAPSLLPPKITAMLTIGVGVAKAILGCFETDGAPQLAPTQGMTAVKMLFCAVFLGLMAMGTTGCNRKPSPLPAWAVTAPERTVGDTIAAAVGAVDRYEADVKEAKPGTENAVLRATMQDVQRALTIAQPAYRTWADALKANPSAPEPANLAGAVAALQQALSKIPTYLK